MKTEDKPPRPLNAAIIWGSAVIFTFRANQTPMTPPRAMAPSIQAYSLTVGE